MSNGFCFDNFYRKTKIVIFSFDDNFLRTWNIESPRKPRDSSHDILLETLSLDFELIVEATESEETSWHPDRQQLPNCNPNQMIVPARTNQNHRYVFDSI